ncbi:putative protein YqeY [Candidatus Hepatincola sp. Pdp]
MLKDTLQKEVNQAMKAKASERLSILRMIMAKIKDQEINKRTESSLELQDSDIIVLMDKMIKQAQDSIQEYKKANRQDLIQKEEAEIQVIMEFMPKPLSHEEVNNAITQAIADVKPEGMKDMGKVINYIKNKYVGRVDMAKVSLQVKEHLNTLND